MIGLTFNSQTPSQSSAFPFPQTFSFVWLNRQRIVHESCRKLLIHAYTFLQTHSLGLVLPAMYTYLSWFHTPLYPWFEDCRHVTVNDSSVSAKEILTVAFTLFIAARQAWREKIALCILYLGLSALFLFWLEYISTLFCDSEHAYSYSLVFQNDSKYAAINGKAVEWSKYADSSPIANDVSQYNSLDVSPMFPSFMMLDRKGADTYSNPKLQQCIGDTGKSELADNWLSYKLSNDPGYTYRNGELVSCPYPNATNVTGEHCYTSQLSQIPLPVKGGSYYAHPDIFIFRALRPTRCRYFIHHGRYTEFHNLVVTQRSRESFCCSGWRYIGCHCLPRSGNKRDWSLGWRLLTRIRTRSNVSTSRRDEISFHQSRRRYYRVLWRQRVKRSSLQGLLVGIVPQRHHPWQGSHRVFKD